MAIEVVGSIEPLSANLTEKLLVVRVGMDEKMSLKVVLFREPLSAHLAGDGHLLRFSSLSTYDQVPDNFERFGLMRFTLDERQTLLVNGVFAENSVHEGALWDRVSQL